MSNWQERKKVLMNNKYYLNGTDIYIDNDTTKNELEIQKNLRVIAKKEMGNGKRKQGESQTISQISKDNCEWKSN